MPPVVRSSGVDEDGSDTSYAGLFTVLDVGTEGALVDAVRTCWRSASDPGSGGGHRCGGGVHGWRWPPAELADTLVVTKLTGSPGRCLTLAASWTS